MKLEFRTHAQHLSFKKFRKCNSCDSYRKLFKQIHVYINYLLLINISKNKKSQSLVSNTETKTFYPGDLLGSKNEYLPCPILLLAFM